LVLNYDLREDHDSHDGTPDTFSYRPVLSPIPKNPNTKGLKLGPDHYNPSLTRAEKSGRHAPRARRLNLSDVDWYGARSQPFASNRRKGTSSPLVSSYLNVSES